MDNRLIENISLHSGTQTFANSCNSVVITLGNIFSNFLYAVVKTGGARCALKIERRFYNNSQYIYITCKPP